jgi:hypothetical protein
MTWTNDAYTEIHLYVDPSELRLARVARLVQVALGHFGQLHTGRLPAPHVPDGDRVEHYSELSLTTPLKQLRVAPENVHCAKNSVLFSIQTNCSGSPLLMSVLSLPKIVHLDHAVFLTHE